MITEPWRLLYPMKMSSTGPAAIRKLAAVGWIGCCLAVLEGCRPSGTSVMGVPPTDTPTPIASALAGAPGTVTVEGAMIEKCPVAGCWFVIRDSSATLRVDTKSAGFVVTEVPLNQRVVVTGELTSKGAQRELNATGIRY